MAKKRRLSVSEKIRAWRRKKSIAKNARFPRGEIKGNIIYRNPNAVPVPKEIAAQGERKPFTLENVEWISKLGLVFTSKKSNVLAEGGFGTIFWGRIKFKGKTSSERVILKQHHTFVSDQHLQRMPTVIARLERSGVPHPKMAYLETWNAEEEKECYIVMEPFVRVAEKKDRRTKQRVVYSKFSPGADFVRKLKLSHKRDADAFRQCVEHTVSLAKAGLWTKMTQDIIGRARADAFNGFILRDGRIKVFVQDLDSIFLGKNVEQNWVVSAMVLYKAVIEKEKSNDKRALKIINEVAKKHGLPEISSSD